MKRIARSSLLSALTLALAMAHAAWARPAMRQPVHYSLEPISGHLAPGSVSMRLTVSTDWLCDQVRMRVTTWGGLEYAGVEEFAVVLDYSRSASRILDLSIPDNDTSGIVMEFVCDDRTWAINFSMVATGDSAWTVNADLRFFRAAPLPLSDEQWDSLGNANAIYYDDLHPRSDSLCERLITGSLTERLGPQIGFGREITLEQMRELEREPLTDSAMQAFIIDGQAWVRRQGEQKFHLVEPPDRAELQERYRRVADSIAALPLDAVLNICLVLRDSTVRRRAEEIVCPLGRPEVPGMYHIGVTKRAIEQLREAGIPFINLHLSPHGHEDRPSEGSEPQGVATP